MIVAIDGPAGSGKSTVAKALAARLGVHYLDTGAMYRSIALAALERGIPLDDAQALAGLAEKARIQFVHEQGEALPSRTLLDGRDVSSAIRTPEVDAAVSAVARVPEVRAAMVAQQRLLTEGEDSVVEGRDIGTVVFPDAEVKVYLDASPEERARRRASDLATAGHATERGDVLADIERRDALDSTRQASPLARADDARVIDTTGLDVDQVVDRIAELVEAATRDTR